MPFDLKGKNEKQLVSIVVEKETVSCEHIERFFFIVAAIFITLTVCQSIQRQLVLLFLFSAAFETVLLRCLLIFQLLMLPLMRQNPLWAR